jgi:sensor histidine kinase YesM
MKQREENLEAQASILVLQMRPHFIYNTMTSIYYLCEQDPKKAMKTIDDFTNYLRKNFSAVAKRGTIPFSEELSHVRTYLEIEKTRFEGNLFVDFDIPYTSFRIPPLTLQPIVENSVKYGVDPELDPLHITISTREVSSGSEITVSDTGPGFPENQEFEKDDREPHIALNNIRERLALLCDGTLTISPGEEGGTVVKIFIP